MAGVRAVTITSTFAASSAMSARRSYCPSTERYSIATFRLSPHSLILAGNGCAERFIRTLKENLLWVRTFDTVEELRQALLGFREIYNTIWLIERHGFQTPAAVRQNQLSPAVMAA